MEKLEILVKVAQELQKICEFEPPIKTKGKSEKELIKLIKEGAEALTPEDKLSKDAVALFKELKITIGAAPAEEEEEEEEAAEVETEEEEEDEPKPAKTKAAKEVKAPKEAKAKEEKAPKVKAEGKMSTAEKIAFFTPLINGKHTASELVAKALEKHPNAGDSALKTFLSDSKNPKYNKFEKLVVADAEGRLSFAK